MLSIEKSTGRIHSTLSFSFPHLKTTCWMLTILKCHNQISGWKTRSIFARKLV